MDTAIQLFVTLGLIITTGFAGADEGTIGAGAESNLTLTLQIHDYAQVSEEILVQANRTLARIFRQMDLRVRFQQHSVPAKNDSPTSPAALSFDSSELKVWILLLPRERAQAFRNLNLNKDAFGYTPQPGQIAYLFVDRIKDFARSQARNRYLAHIRSWGKVLGHLIAHEVGHMFLPSNYHSESGIMRAKWDRRVLEQIGHNDLLFTRRQSELARTEIYARIKQQEDLDLGEFEN